MASAATIARRVERHMDALARGTESYVATPEDLADTMCGWPYTDLPMLPPGATVLEPSAGKNHLVRAILDANRYVHVTAVEPSAARSGVGRPVPLDGWGYPTAYTVDYVLSTFEAFAADNPGRLFDAVIMNPPFTLVDQPALWIDHVRLAWDMVKPGGRLVSIVPNGFKYRSEKRHAALRELVGAHGWSKALPAGAFKESGWTGSAMVVWMVKPLAGAATGLVPTYTGREVPVRVPYFRMGGEAVTAAPVQISTDRSWGNRGDRVLRYMGQCVNPSCRHLTWAFDDGENDPRGPLGTAAASALDAVEFGMVGPSIALCFMCDNDYEAREAALKVAAPLWSQRPARPAPPVLRPADDGGLFALDFAA